MVDLAGAEDVFVFASGCVGAVFAKRSLLAWDVVFVANGSVDDAGAADDAAGTGSDH